MSDLALQISKPLPEFRQVSGVYALIDPRSGRVMYVGQSLDADYRYRQHINPNVYDSNREKVAWVAGLRAQGLAPKLVVLAECDWPESDEVEKRYIRMYKSLGQCELNKAVGGKANRGVPKVANSHQDDWFQLGRKLKRVHSLLMEASDDAGKVAGAKGTAFVIEAAQGVEKLQTRLDAMLVKAMPGWAEFSRVFFGPREDD